MAGLVGGDSDSSALTQESGDEAAFTPRESVVTGTDAGTDYEDEPEVQEASPGLWSSWSTWGDRDDFAASVPPRVGRGGRPPKLGRGGSAGRGRAGSTSLGRGGGKKRKK